MPTFERAARFDREFRRLPWSSSGVPEMLPIFIEALRCAPPTFPRALRVKRVQGMSGVWEVTFSADGRATFAYGDDVQPGEPHVVWRRVGTHDVLSDPDAGPRGRVQRIAKRAWPLGLRFADPHVSTVA